MSRRAKVTFDYEASEEDELNLTVGKTVENVIDEDVGWCRGTFDGKTGLFPSNFVEFIDNSESIVAPQEPNTPKAGSLSGKKAKVNFEYDAANEDELALKLGDIVEIHGEVEDGWWEGSLRGNIGVFPSNFVDLIKEEEPIAAPAPLSKDVESEPRGNDEEDDDKANKRASIIGQAKMMGGGMGFGNLINPGILSGTKLKRVDNKPKKTPEPEEKAPQPEPSSPFKKGASLKKRAPVPPANQPPPAPVLTPAPAPAPIPVKKPMEKAKVLFDYEPVNDDELKLTVGEIVTVHNKEVYETEGWWKGENSNGKVGLFPDNFVELLPEEKEMPPNAHVPSMSQHKKVPPAPTTAHQEKVAPPPLPTEEIRTPPVGEPPKDMKKANDFKKIPQPRDNGKPSIEPSKPSLPPKKPMPPKPPTKPILPIKKPLPKPPADSKKEVSPRFTSREPLTKKEITSVRPALRTDEKMDDSSISASEDCNLDAVEPHKTLTHLTTNRAKLQAKRPPSRQSEGSLIDVTTGFEIEEEEKKRPADVEPKEPAWKREAREARETRETKKLEEKAPPSVPFPVVKEKKPISEKREEKDAEKRISWKDEPVTKKTDTVPSEEVTSLRKEVTDLKSTLQDMEKRIAAMDRKHEERLRSLEKRLEKDIEQLTSDFDEERSNQARLKIEIDRLKKKMRRGSSSIDEHSSLA